MLGSMAKPAGPRSARHTTGSAPNGGPGSFFRFRASRSADDPRSMPLTKFLLLFCKSDLRSQSHLSLSPSHLSAAPLSGRLARNGGQFVALRFGLRSRRSIANVFATLPLLSNLLERAFFIHAAREEEEGCGDRSDLKEPSAELIAGRCMRVDTRPKSSLSRR